MNNSDLSNAFNAYQPQEHIGLYRLSDAAEHYSREQGQFEVRYKRDEYQLFPTLASAFMFYLQLPYGAELWDITEQRTIIERKIPVPKTKER